MKRLFYFLGLLLLMNGWRLRTRAARLPVLPASDARPDPDHVFWAAPGLELSDETRSAASAWATSNQLQVLDILPADLGTEPLIRLLAKVDPDRYQTQRLAAGQTAAQAMLVQRGLVERAGLHAPTNAGEFEAAAVRLKRFARNYGFAIAANLQAVPEDPRWREAPVRENLALVSPLICGAHLLGAVLPALGLLWSRPAGLAALAAYHLQGLLATAGTALRPYDLGASLLFRTGKEVRAWLTCLFKPLPPRGISAPEMREVYNNLLAGGVERFFEPRRQTCPLCGGDDLRMHVRSHDIVQGKPGEFRLERCGSCGHIFQNPRLTPEGLSFYYRDAYESSAEQGRSGGAVRKEEARARRLEGYCTPRRWLDVGSGYGHFCVVAQDVWPQTEFDALDQVEGLEMVAEQGWAKRAFNRPFPEVAPDLADTYDVVSMSHYIEHTRDPRAELKAAHQVLREGGYLSIEVPNPANPLHSRLGRFWLGWLQPQHQHFLNVDNFNRLFAETGFEPVRWYWKEAHLNAEFGSAAMLFLGWLAPYPDAPWRPRASLAQKLRFFATWALLTPVLFIPAYLLDFLVGNAMARPGLSFNYGVLARRVDAPASKDPAAAVAQEA